MAEQGVDRETERRVFDLYDDYCHGRLDRREFLQTAAALTIGGVSALAMAQSLLPRYAEAQTISFTDPRIKGKYVTYPSPGGNSGTMRGYLVQPDRGGAVPGRPGDPREPRAQSLHRGRGAPRRDRGVPGARARRVVPRRWIPGQRRRRPHAAGRPGPGQAAYRHGQQRALREGARAVDRQARGHRLLLGRQHDQLPGRHARRRPEGRRAVLRRARPRRRACRASRRR